MKTEVELQQLLVSLGSNAKEVAQSLKERGIKGRPRRKCDCPIARFLVKETGPEYEWGVGSRSVYCLDDKLEEVILIMNIPVAIQEFIQMFDNREFPELIA